MDETSRPASLNDVLSQRLRELPTAARLIVVLDPDARLGLEPELTLERRKWQIIRYDGNDLAFRRQFRLDGRIIIWATRPAYPPKGTEPLTLDLSSLVDVIRRADEILDLSLVGVLSAIIAGETWPPAPVERHAEILSNRLDVLADAYAALRPHLKGAALDAHSVRALALHCLQPGIQPHEFLFTQDTPARVLNHYVTLAWAVDWDEAGRDLLRQQALEASKLPLDKYTKAWFEVAPDNLSQFLYLYRFLSRARVPNVVNQIRGLGLLGFDPELLEPAMNTVLALWARDAGWRSRVIRQAESSVEMADIRRALALLDLSSPDKVADAIALAEAPALIYHLGGRLLETAQANKQMSKAMAAWAERRPPALNGLDETDTPFARAALAIACILDEAAFISARLARPIDPPPGLAGILDWYVEGGYYDLEFAHARATSALRRLPDEDLRSFVQAYLDHLWKGLREYLDQADHELARRITGNWHDYMNSPRLSPRVLWDFVKSARLKPADTECLWFIVFDGMRYDTWQKIVKPRLTQRFEVKKEKAYLCVLPSWTRIARSSLIAGRTPDTWRGPRKTFTFDEAALASGLFDLSEADQDRKLRFYSGMESDRTARKLDRKKRYPYNVLVFNISDDDLHKQRDHLGALNQSIETALNNILDLLDGLILPTDTVIVSSDHGFMELDPEDAVPVKDDTHWERFMQGAPHPVRFRYIMGIDPPAGLQDVYSFEYRQVRDGKFTVPIGRKWFQRQGTTQTDRYAHGGLSLAEMVVPGAVLQLIAEKKIDLVFENLPEELTLDEGVPTRTGIWIRNRGNQPGEFQLTCAVDTDASPQVATETLAPGSHVEVPVSVTPVLQPGGRVTRSLGLALKFTTSGGKPKTIKREIPIQVRERKDVVEISFGGLDDLDL